MNTLPYHERYQILNPLASGGMSKLYLARDPRNDEFVVIKIMTPIQEDDRRNRKALERFQREIDIARKLKHPHVLPVLDAGYIQEHGRDIPFFITRYIQDGSLANYIDRKPPW